MVPVYSTASCLQIYLYTHSVYVSLARAAYAAFALASSYSLMMAYAFAGPEELYIYKRSEKPKPWKNGISLQVGLLRRLTGGERGPFKTPRTASTWHNVRTKSDTARL